MVNYKIGISINPNGYNSVDIYEDCPELAESSIHTVGLPQSDSRVELEHTLQNLLRDPLWCADNGVLMVYDIPKPKTIPTTIIFGERSIGSDFPTDGVEIPFKAENEERWQEGLQFFQNGYAFTFDHSVSHNGWWAAKPGVRGVCRVHIS